MIIIHPTTGMIWPISIGITASDFEAFQNGIWVFTANTLDNMKNISLPIQYRITWFPAGAAQRNGLTQKINRGRNRIDLEVGQPHESVHPGHHQQDGHDGGEGVLERTHDGGRDQGCQHLNSVRPMSLRRCRDPRPATRRIQAFASRSYRLQSPRYRRAKQSSSAGSSLR